jgi:hypothetical protein
MVVIVEAMAMRLLTINNLMELPKRPRAPHLRWRFPALDPIVLPLLGRGGLRQLRQPLVPAQRRGEPHVFEEAFARGQTEIFAQDRARSKQVTLEAWRDRPFTERLEELVARALRRQL